MKKDSVKSNFGFQIAYQVVMLFIPLIVAPYLTRTLGSNNLGAYAYVHSIAYYFVLFAMLGIAKYGQRVIAQNSDNNDNLRKSFWSLFSLHVILSAISLFIYFLFILFFVKDNKVLFLIDGFYVASALFNVSWFFYGLENFRHMVYRNMAVKIVECVAIFLLVKSSSDVTLYAAICGVSLLCGQAVMLPLAMKIVPWIKFKKKDVFVHIKPMSIFALAVLAVSLYTIFDKTLLGMFAENSDVAFFEYSDRIVRIPIAFIVVVGQVLLPRACKLVKDGDDNNQRNYFALSLIYTSLVASLSFWLLCSVGKELAIGYFGEEFSPCGGIMKIMAPLILVIGIGDVIRTQYIIPLSKDRHYTISITSSAVLNVVICAFLLNILNGPYKIYGVVCGTISAELFGMLYQLFVCRKQIKFEHVYCPVIASFVPGFVMFVLLWFIRINVTILLLDAILKGIIGILIYLVLYLPSMYVFYKDGYKKIVGILPLNIFRKKNV